MKGVRRLVVRCDCGREVVVSGYVNALSSDERRLRRKAVDIVAKNPEEYTRSQLCMLLGARRNDALRVVQRLILDGVLGPDTKRARLSVEGRLPEAPHTRKVGKRIA